MGLNTYRVWHAEDDPSAKYAKTCRHTDPEYAAEEYAEEVHADMDFFTQIDLRVRDVDSGEEWSLRVEVEAEPVFRAYHRP